MQLKARLGRRKCQMDEWHINAVPNESWPNLPDSEKPGYEQSHVRKENDQEKDNKLPDNERPYAPDQSLQADIDNSAYCKKDDAHRGGNEANH